MKYVQSGSARTTSSDVASSFVRVGSIIVTSIAQNYAMAVTEGIHEGAPKNESIHFAKEYYFDDWSLQSHDLGASVPPVAQSLETIKAATDVTLFAIPIKPQVLIGPPIFRTYAPKLIDFGTKQIFKSGRDAALDPLYPN